MDEQSKEKLIELFQKARVASLGTSANDQPFVSMVAFSFSATATEFYLLLSNLALHTKNININHKVSLMISQSDLQHTNPQMLSRISFMGTISLIEKANLEYTSIKENYTKKNPDSITYLDLGGFNLYKIKINTARYVAGFGKTFRLSTESFKSIFLE